MKVEKIALAEFNRGNKSKRNRRQEEFFIDKAFKKEDHF